MQLTRKPQFLCKPQLLPKPQLLRKFFPFPDVLAMGLAALAGLALSTQASAQTALTYTESGIMSVSAPSQSDRPSEYHLDPGGMGSGTFGATPFYGTEGFFFTDFASDTGNFYIQAYPTRSSEIPVGSIGGLLENGKVTGDTYVGNISSTYGDGIFAGYQNNGIGTLTVTGLPLSRTFGLTEVPFSSTSHVVPRVAAVPEPSALVLLGLGAVPLWLTLNARRRRANAS